MPLETDWRTEALEFMRQNEICRNHLTVQLVEAAMQEGARLATLHATKLVDKAFKEIEAIRVKNFIG